MAALHASFWDGGAEIEVVPVMHRYLELSPWTAIAEAHIGATHRVPQLIGKGWALLAEVASQADAVVTKLAWNPGPLVEALVTTPQTFVHGNWKLDNLGTDAEGRTVLLDWELPGRGAPLSDLAWYLAINCRRLPQSKEAAGTTTSSRGGRRKPSTPPTSSGEVTAKRQGIELTGTEVCPIGQRPQAAPARRPNPTRIEHETRTDRIDRSRRR